MAACPSCDTENAEEAKFCSECGAGLAEVAPAREARKTVTVLFCDVTGSTELGEHLDPGSLRGAMERYFARMQAVLEAHGGTVEKFIGDADHGGLRRPTDPRGRRDPSGTGGGRDARGDR